MLSSQRASLPPKVAKSGRLRSFVVSYGYAAIYCADNSPIKFRLTGVSFWGLLWERHFLFLWIQTNLRGQKLLPEGPLRRSSDTCHASFSLSSLLFSALEKVGWTFESPTVFHPDFSTYGLAPALTFVRLSRNIG